MTTKRNDIGDGENEESGEGEAIGVKAEVSDNQRWRREPNRHNDDRSRRRRRSQFGVEQRTDAESSQTRGDDSTVSIGSSGEVRRYAEHDRSSNGRRREHDGK
jgi:hypothetical protein